jgi:hypothetical protein
MVVAFFFIAFFSIAFFSIANVSNIVAAYIVAHYLNSDVRAHAYCFTGLTDPDSRAHGCSHNVSA